MDNDTLQKKGLIYTMNEDKRAREMTGDELVRSIYTPEELQRMGYKGPFKTEEEKNKEFIEGVNSIPDSLVEGKTVSDIIEEQNIIQDEETSRLLQEAEEEAEKTKKEAYSQTGDQLVRSLYTPEELERMGYDKMFSTDKKNELEAMLSDNTLSNDSEVYDNGLGKM